MSELLLLTGFLWAWTLATLSIAVVHVHRRAAPGPCLRAIKEEDGMLSPRAILVLTPNRHDSISDVCYQQKGWKSVNLAQPFSSAIEGPAAHALEPTSLAAPGAADSGFTGSSKTAVHVVPARRRCSSQE